MQHVARALCNFTQGFEFCCNQRHVAVCLVLGEAIHLTLFQTRNWRCNFWLWFVVDRELVDANQHASLIVDRFRVAVCGFFNFIHLEAGFNCLHCPTHFVDARNVFVCKTLNFIRERFDKVRTSKWVWSVGYSAFITNDLLRAQCNARGFFSWQAERFVVTIGVQTLRSTQHGSHALYGHANHVVQRLLCGKC